MAVWDVSYTTVVLPDLVAQQYAPVPVDPPPPFIAVEENGPYQPGWPNNQAGEVAIPFQMSSGQQVTTGPTGGDLSDGSLHDEWLTKQAEGRVGIAAQPLNGQMICGWNDPKNGFELTFSYYGPIEENSPYGGTATAWQQPFGLGQTSFQGVDVCLNPYDANAVMVAWTGTDENSVQSGTVNWGAMPFGYESLTILQTLWGQTAVGSPAITVSPEHTFVAWTGTDPQNMPNIVKVTGDGNANDFIWDQAILGDDSSPVAPRLSFLDPTYTGLTTSGLLCLTWLGTDGRMNILLIDPDSGQGTKYIVGWDGPAITGPPAFLSLGYGYLAFPSGDQIFIAASSQPASNWSEPGAWTSALGLLNGQDFDSGQRMWNLVVGEWGVGLSYDLVGDGLLLGYVGVPIDSSLAPIGWPAYGQLSLDPSQWNLNL
jgi:hypothetical protein